MENNEEQGIDYPFIMGLEGYSKTGYVPEKDGKPLGESGVTIASGFDLGKRSIRSLEGLPEDLVMKLAPYLGVRGEAAQNIAPSLKITSEEADMLNEVAKNQTVGMLSNLWKNKTGTDFQDLPSNKQTVLASVAFQYGDLESRTPNFWKQTTSGDWDAATDNLRNFGDRYESRRTREADYLMEGRLSETLARTAPPDAPSRELTDEQLIAKVQEEADPSKKNLK